MAKRKKGGGARNVYEALTPGLTKPTPMPVGGVVDQSELAKRVSPSPIKLNQLSRAQGPSASEMSGKKPWGGY